MKFIFILISFLLLLYQFKSTLIYDFKEHVVLLWRLKNQFILKILPMDYNVLIEDKIIYIYLEDSEENYIPAVSIKGSIKHSTTIPNYKYLTSWSKNYPEVKTYPSNLTNVLDIVNYIAA